MKPTIFNTVTCTLALLLAVPFATTHVQSANSVIVQEAQQIAKEAYIYGNPMVDNYRIVYAYFMDTEGPEYKAPFNTLKNIPRVCTPEDIHQYRQGDQWRFYSVRGNTLKNNYPYRSRRCGTGHLWRLEAGTAMYPAYRVDD